MKRNDKIPNAAWPIVAALLGLSTAVWAQTQAPQVGAQIRVGTSPTGAVVVCDGIVRDVAPLTITGLEAGEHLIIARQSGYRECRRTVELAEAAVPAMVEHCDIAYMRAHAANLPAFTRVFRQGAASFFNQGTNGRWRDELTAQELARCDAIAARELTPECAHWLRTGALPEETQRLESVHPAG